MIVLGEHRFSPLAADVHQLSAEPQFGHHIRRKYAEIPEDVMSLKTRRRLVFNVSHPDCERNAEFVRERLPISMQATIIHTKYVADGWYLVVRSFVTRTVKFIKKSTNF